MCTTNVHMKYDFLLSKCLNSPNLCYKWATMWYPGCQNKKRNSICACSIVSRVPAMNQINHRLVTWLLKLKKINLRILNSLTVFIYASYEPLCGTVMINLGKTSIFTYYCRQIKTSFLRISIDSRDKILEILTTNNI